MTVSGEGQWLRPPSGSTPTTVTAHGASIGLSGSDQIMTGGGPDTVLFTDTILDTDSYVSTSGGGKVITIPSGKAGLYIVSSEVDLISLSSDAFDVNWIVYIYKNGSTLIAYQQVTALGNTGLDQDPHISRLLVLAEGDVLHVEAAGPGNTGCKIFADPTVSFLDVAWLGSTS